MGCHANFYYPIEANKLKLMSKRQSIYYTGANRKINKMIKEMPECVIINSITDLKSRILHLDYGLLVNEVNLNCYPRLDIINYDTVFTDFKSFKKAIEKEWDANHEKKEQQYRPDYLGKVEKLFKKYPRGFIFCG